MKIAHFIYESREQLGAAVGDRLLLLSSLSGAPSERTHSLAEMVRTGRIPSKLDVEVREAVSRGTGSFVGLEQVAFLPCVPTPGKILCVGLNYRTHARETGMPVPEVPVIFSKFSDTIAAHREEIPFPPGAAQLDYEGELGIIIGQETFQVGEAEALDHVFGYFAANDVSARDFQLRTSQWLLGKTCEKFCPVGPYIVTAGEVGDPGALGLQTRVNGELRQDSSTSDMVFNCAEIISYISRHIRMSPGDVILTGTPSGVILGKPESQRVWLKPGDEMSVSIEKLGTLTNRIAPFGSDRG